MKPCVYQLLCAVCFLMSGLIQTSADFNTEMSKVTEACSETIHSCRGESAPSTDAEWCALFGESADGVTPYQCAVRIGLCTDEEFVALKNVACGQTATAQQSSSSLKTSFYKAITSTDEACQDKIVSFIFESSVATILKQQEKYCKLINLGITDKTTIVYLTPECSDPDIASLNKSACSTTQSQPFPDAIVATSTDCQDGVERCASSVISVVQGENYCDVMTTTTRECLATEGCTESEISRMKTAVCSGSRAVASVIMLALVALHQIF